jgi:hypothetical protein
MNSAKQIDSTPKYPGPQQVIELSKTAHQNADGSRVSGIRNRNTTKKISKALDNDQPSHGGALVAGQRPVIACGH